MVQSPSWEANWFAASQEIPRISQNPKVHFCIYSIKIINQLNYGKVYLIGISFM